MEVSPLTQQARPSSFQPKIDRLYDDLLKDEVEITHLEGFWLEFFLLKPDRSSLQRRFDELGSDDLLHFQYEIRQLFIRAASQIKSAKPPSDENALDTLTVILGAILAKRYTNPSADIITVLAGLDEVDSVFSDFANSIEFTIRAGRSIDVRYKAIQVALSLTSGAYQTSLVSYFTHRDLFPALMKYIQENDEQTPDSEPFLLLGLLANYNKFEFRNPYRLRLEDFVNETTIQKIVKGFGHTCSQLRDDYVALQEDVNEGWSLSIALSYIGLSALAPKKSASPAPHNDDVKEHFASLPEPKAAVLLAAYDFTNANKLFCFNLVSCLSEKKNQESPFGAFLSLTSYILHHAYRSPNATLYGLLNLLTLRLIIEDPTLCKILCNPEFPLQVRLCRQRQPFLPLVSAARPSAASILDILIDTLNHNLRRRLDLTLYISCIGMIHRFISYLVFTRTRLTYHWSLLWQTLLSLLRFLLVYAPDLKTQHPELPALLIPFLATLALSVSAGDAFLPDAAAYDDLFYKLVEAGHYLPRFKEAFQSHITPPPSASATTIATSSTNTPTNGPTGTSPIDLLIHVSTHYHALLEAEKEKGRMGKNLSPREVGKIIRFGSETLQVPAAHGLDLWPKFREGEERALLKRIARVAVEDTRRLVRGG